ncbi:MAG: PEP-CTERM sorting domain-containing protein [Phycisphaeraceae bacterium]|nr:PEP-CTERM sorting domain-containing protein [Phycisphaeraceae bacterium]
MKSTRLAAIALLVVCLASRTSAAVVFLSTHSWYDMFNPPSQINPTVTLAPGETAHLYLWAYVGYNEYIQGMGIDILSSTPGIAVANQVQVDHFPWNPQSAWPTAGNLATGFDLDGAVPYLGLPGSNPGWHEGYVQIPEAILGLWNVAEFTVEGLAPGTTNVFITSNQGGGITYRAPYGGPLTNLGWGDAAVDTTLGPGIASTLADATIVVTPEPATVGLMSLAGALVLVRRRV